MKNYSAGSSVDQQMNVFGKIFRYALDDVAAEEVEEAVADRSAKDELGSADGGRDVHDSVGDRIAYRVARKDRVPVRHAPNLGEDSAGFLVIGPAAFVILLAQDRHGADEQ